MITIEDLQEAIAECEGQRHPNASTCVKLAAFYTIREHMFGEPQEPQPVSYSFSAQGDAVEYDGDSEFAQAVRGRDPVEMWAIMDELMSSLAVLNPRLYAGVMRRITE